MVYQSEWDEKAFLFTNHEGVHCRGPQLANHIKSKRSRYMRITKEHESSGSACFDPDSLSKEDRPIYDCFDKVLVDKHIPRYQRLVKSNNVSNYKIPQMLLFFQFLAINFKFKVNLKFKWGTISKYNLKCVGKNLCKN